MAMQSRRQIVSTIALIPALSLARRANAQTGASPDEIWKTFVEWLPNAPRGDGPPSMIFNSYRDSLIKAGVPAQEANQRLDVIRRLHLERPDAWRVMFNNIYTSDKPGFATQPNAFLVSTAESSQTRTRPGHRNGTGAQLCFSRAERLGCHRL